MMVRLALLCTLVTACSGPQHPAAEPLERSAAEMLAPRGGARPAVPIVIEVPMVIEGDRGRIDVLAEVANTAASRARGLMYRESLDEGLGMLFVYEKRDVHTFWMKNTLIPLDMLFLDGPPHLEFISVIGIVHNAEPKTLTRRSVSAPSRYVLELPGGWARKMGISEGSRVSWESLPEPLKTNP